MPSSSDRVDSPASGSRPVAPEAGPALSPVRHSLRAKGLLATFALLAYVLGASLYVAGERGEIFRTMQTLDQLGPHERALALTEAAVSNALIDVSQAGGVEANDPEAIAELQLYMESCGKLFDGLEVFDGAYALPRRGIERAYADLRQRPERANWIGMREALKRAQDHLEIRQQRLAAQREQLTQSYQRQYNTVTVESLLLAAVGLVCFGSLAAWFFARLASDIRRLELHARQIVRGTRGVALASKRSDELGHLIHSVNRMAADLDERERQIRVDAERQSHQEKMLTVGALAAGVAHEVNNPLAAISGLAQELQQDAAILPPEAVAGHAALILSQTQRAAQAARQLAEVAAPQPADLDWVDFNALLRHAVQLMGYDRRYRRLELKFDADAGLPALRNSAVALQQVVMQLLSLVCDALLAPPQPTQEGANRPPPLARPGIALHTRAVDDGIELQLQFAPSLDFARVEVQRRLLLCRAIVEPMRGRLAFGQEPGSMQSIKLVLPLDVVAAGV